jgi:hypothetical protein
MFDGSAEGYGEMAAGKVGNRIKRGADGAPR